MFDRFQGVTYREVVQPKANELIESDQLDQFDLILFYDMYDSITVPQKDAYVRMVKQKKPLLFLHHSLVSYQDWPEFTQIIGGKYHTKDSTRTSYYQHDDTINVSMSPLRHPVIKGLHDFTIIDETYGNCEILPTVVPLLETDHPRSLPVIGWVNNYLGHEMVYLQGGHGPSAFKDPNYLKVLEQAIRWSVDH
jgi:type 1 glutamine amidotransferase